VRFQAMENWESYVKTICSQCRIFGSHSGRCECCHLLGYRAVWSVCEPTFFGGTFRLHLQGRKSAEQETSVQQLAKHTGALLGWFSTLMMEVIRSSETSVHVGIHVAISQKMAAFIYTRLYRFSLWPELRYCLKTLHNLKHMTLTILVGL
jgi:hypothetical protein